MSENLTELGMDLVEVYEGGLERLAKAKMIKAGAVLGGGAGTALAAAGTYTVAAGTVAEIGGVVYGGGATVVSGHGLLALAALHPVGAAVIGTGLGIMGAYKLAKWLYND
jgi:hypothetical protein